MNVHLIISKDDFVIELQSLMSRGNSLEGDEINLEMFTSNYKSWQYMVEEFLSASFNAPKNQHKNKFTNSRGSKRWTDALDRRTNTNSKEYKYELLKYELNNQINTLESIRLASEYFKVKLDLNSAIQATYSINSFVIGDVVVRKTDLNSKMSVCKIDKDNGSISCRAKNQKEDYAPQELIKFADISQ